MAYEIERKFLVKGEFKQFALSSTYIVQGYIYFDKEKSVRVRIRGDKGFITVKSSVGDSKVTRNEWEYEVPASEANEMLRLCGKNVIEKTRYIVNVKNLTVEVDEFYGENEGLLLAEIELTNESQQFEKPDFLGQEVTGQPRYYNAQLCVNPYSKWRS
ncbi:MAG: CYTH domain-containing protein [Bacteroidales bacterium]|nr:CYTH domain-containing protein [Bacteroidales bacterium]MBQ5539672.1 CYTH domain-containing protein [Bacteroidales bacterium]MBR4677269.1 CYTH domain-containing protein [Bacteroidales bacterium]